MKERDILTIGNNKIWWRLPAVRALAIQCLSLALIILLFAAIFFVSGFKLPLGVVVLLQGIGAAALARWLKLAPWWWVIEFLFVPALLAGTMLNVYPVAYLFAFLFFLALYWSTYRTQVPFYPSGAMAWDSVASLLPQDKNFRFIDIGSGFGGLILELSRRRPDAQFIGIELAPLPWFASRIYAAVLRSKGNFVRGDYNQLDFSNFDVIFAYLSPAAMSDLWEKARKEMRPGSLLLSYEFPIPGVESQITNISDTGGRILYGWNM